MINKLKALLVTLFIVGAIAAILCVFLSIPITVMVTIGTILLWIIGVSTFLAACSAIYQIALEYYEKK